jgi:hypothetical protein
MSGQNIGKAYTPPPRAACLISVRPVKKMKYEVYMMRYSGKHVSKKIFAKYYLVLTFPNS